MITHFGLLGEQEINIYYIKPLKDLSAFVTTQSPSLNTPSLGGAPPGLMFSPTFNPGDAPAPQQAPHAVSLIP